MKSVGDILRAAPKMLVPVLHAYQRRLQRYGTTARGVFWKNTEWQHRRYVILERVFDDLAQAGGQTVLDFGCGYGSLFDYLADHPVLRHGRYIGADMCQDMIDAARARIDDPRASFVRAIAATEEVGYTLVSGTYNMHLGADAAEWDSYIKASLKQLWRHSRHGLAFNMLSRNADEQYDGLYYTDPDDYLAFTREYFSTHAELIIEPPLPDFTIIVRRDA